MGRDFYEILGVNRSATDDEIKRAYRKLAQKHHPDRNKGDKASEEKFKGINAAYETLSDKKKRGQYDQFGESAAGSGGPGMSGFDFSNMGGFGDSFSEIFETFFSGGGSARQSRKQNSRGEDQEVSILITFEEAAFGTEKEIRLNRIGECGNCNGSGAVPGAKIITCKTCSGTGEIKIIKNTIIGQMATRRVCDSCKGAGRIPEKPCSVCHGSGSVRISEKLKVKIPAGISDGSAIRIAGKGNRGLYGGDSGDLYAYIQIQPHKFFERKGSDVFSQQGIHISQAVLGDEIDIKTINGVVKMKIPAGTAYGKTFKLKGYGVVKLNRDEKGDHYVTIIVDIPQKTTKREQELYKELAAQAGIKLEDKKGFFRDMLKNKFS